MSVTITERPQRTVNALIPQVSRWTAVWHPVIFKAQRRDYAIADIQVNAGSGGGMAVYVTGDATAEVEVGDFVYVFSNAAGYASSYEVLDVYTTGSPLQTVIVIDAPVITAASIDADSYVNITGRLAYFVEVRILEYTTGSPVELTDAYARFQPDATGLVKMDLQAWLQTMLAAVDEFDYLQVSAADPNLGQPFNIQVREFWKVNGFTDWSTVTDDNLHYVVNAARQVGDELGQNMGQFVIFPPDQASPPQAGSRGGFLTMFEEPVYWEGYPFDLGFIYSDEYDVQGTLIKTESLVNAAGTQVGLNLDVLADGSGFVNRLTLQGGYASTVDRVCVTLRAQGGDAYVDDDYVDVDYVDEDLGTANSESLCIRVNAECPVSPVYLRWLHPRGAFDSWLFTRSQDHLDEAGDEHTLERYAEDLAVATAREQTQRKSVQEKIVIGAQGLTRSQREGLRHLLSAPLVERFMGTDGTTLRPRWQRVGVGKGTFLINRTDEPYGDLVLTITPPERYLQQQ